MRVSDMRKSYLRILAALLVWMAASAGHAETAGQLVQRKHSGKVNWSAGIVGVEGSGRAAGAAAKTRVAAIEMARADATEMARQNLLEILRDLRVDTSYRLSDITVTRPQVGFQIQAMVDHLPAIDQLDSMYVHMDEIGGFDIWDYYISSTEASSNNAWRADFWDGSSASRSKNNAYLVRPIRSF